MSAGDEHNAPFALLADHTLALVRDTPQRLANQDALLRNTTIRQKEEKGKTS